MKIKFWGIRGSIGVSGKSYTGFGGHTSCIEVTAGRERLILDAGSGIRLLGKDLSRSKIREHHLLLTHFHYDHVSGLGFFEPLYHQGHTLHIHGPGSRQLTLKTVLKNLFRAEYFPVDLKKVPASLQFKSHRGGRFRIGSFHIETIPLNHPGSTIGYIIKNNNNSMAYLCDHEPISHANHGIAQSSLDYENNLLRKLKGVGCLIHDGQFTDQDYPRFIGWGHSPWAYALDLAVKAEVPHLILTHFAPEYEDAFLRKAEKTYRGQSGPIKLTLARELMTCDIGASCPKK